MTRWRECSGRTGPGERSGRKNGPEWEFILDTVLVTGDVNRENAEKDLARFNAALPHYRQIRACHIEQQPMTIDSGLLTANGKLRRDAIAAHFRQEIEAMYTRDDAKPERRAASHS